MNQRDQLIAIVEQQYFKNVDAYDVDGVLKCLADDALFKIRSAEPAEHHGKQEIKDMFEALFESFPKRMIHRDFRHIVDEPNDSIASQFNVELMSQDNKEVFQTNSNFFYVENGLIKEMHVYMIGQNVLTGKGS